MKFWEAILIWVCTAVLAFGWGALLGEDYAGGIPPREERTHLVEVMEASCSADAERPDEYELCIYHGLDKIEEVASVKEFIR